MLFSLAQPAILFPSTAKYRVFFWLATFTILLFFVKKRSIGEEAIKLPQNKYIYAMLIVYTLSEAQFFWLEGTINVFLYWLKKVFLFYLVINIAKDGKDLKRLMWCIIFAVIVLTFIGWDMYFNHPYLLVNEGRLQSVGNYNLSNSFALLLTLTFPLSFSLIEVEKSLLKKFVLLGLLIVFVISCIYTKSRGGTLGMIIGINLCIILSVKLFKSKGLKIVIMGIVISMFIVYGLSIVLSRRHIEGYFGKGGEASSGDRLLAWVVAVRMFVDHPILGIGWEKYEETSRRYNYHKLGAHNTLLSVLAETGIIGFTCFVAILILNFKQLWEMRQHWRLIEDKQDLLILSQGVLISLFCFLVNTSFSVKDHDPIYWAILTLSGVLCGIYLKEKNFNNELCSPKQA